MINIQTMTHQETDTMTCRRCGSSDLHRIPRPQLVKGLCALLSIRHFICAKCHKRTYRSVRRR